MPQKTTTAGSSRALRSTTTGGIQKPISTSRALRPRKAPEEPPPLKKRTPKPLPSYLQPNSTPAALTCPLLDTLPAELLRHINSFLPGSSQVCLTLTCKRALQILGKSPWSTCRPRRLQGRCTQAEYNQQELAHADRQALLKYLSSDSSSSSNFSSISTCGPLTYCEQCDMLHPPFKPPQNHTITKYTQRCFGINGAIDYLPFGTHYKTGYSLVWNHIRHVMETVPTDHVGPIDYLGGEFETLCHPVKAVYKLSSSASRVPGNGGNNLILRHEHKFGRALDDGRRQHAALLPEEVLGLPLRICPHQSTATTESPNNRFLATRKRSEEGEGDLNGPLFTRTILKAFSDKDKKSDKDKEREKGQFRKPTTLEQKDMDALDAGEEGLVFKCRSCPTKWKVEHDGRELKVTTWHCFYEDILSAAKVWPWFVRREAYNLGKNTRNSEYWKQGRTIREFQIE